MCGICGIYNLDGAPVNDKVLMSMNDSLHHRGPDDAGYYLNGYIGLAHRRLSIIDLTTGKQPIYNEDRSAVIVYNGEVYNFLELKIELENKGHRFITQTDTEVILHAYEQWGVECLDKLRGMFAFAIWDNKEQTLFLSRDRLGIKPLYYFYDGKRLLFASELKAIIEDLSVPRDLDLEALSDYLSFGYVPAPKSILQNIRKLPAGYFLLISGKGNKFQIKQYWDLVFDESKSLSEKELCDQLMEVLGESVNLRLMSDVPLGAFLSGGVDSSLVVAMMSRYMQEPVLTNTIGFTLDSFNELGYAKQTAKYFASNHYEYKVDSDAVAVVNQLSWFFDEPFADSSSIPTYYVSKMARQQVKVALSGDGGDENFAGYRRYYYDQLENRIRGFFPPFLRSFMFAPLAAIYPKADWLPQFMRAKTLLTNISRGPEFGYFNSMSQILAPAKRRVLSSDVLGELGGYDSQNVFKEHYRNCNSSDPLSRTQYVDFKTYLVDDILTKVDRASMANSLEVRVPILDHKFVELAAKIPSSLKLKNKTSKYIFKQAASLMLPDEVINRRKMGFSIPVGEWLKKDLVPLAHETLLSSEFKSRGLFNSDYVDRLWEQHQKGYRDNTQPLWTLLSFELWAKRFL